MWAAWPLAFDVSIRMCLAMRKPLMFLDCRDKYHHPCQHLKNSTTHVATLPTCNAELVTKRSMQLVGEMEYCFGVTRSFAWNSTSKMREDGSARRAHRRQMIASQPLNLETEVGRVRSFPMAKEGPRKGQGRGIRKCLASDTPGLFLFLT